MRVDFDLFQAKLEPYNFSSEDLQLLYSNSKFLELDIGESLSSLLELDGFIYFLVDGALREIVTIGNSSQISLSRYTSPFSIDSFNLVHDNDCRILLASSRCELISFPKSILSDLYPNGIFPFSSILTAYDLWAIFTSKGIDSIDEIDLDSTAKSLKTFIKKYSDAFSVHYITTAQEFRNLIESNASAYFGESRDNLFNYGSSIANLLEFADFNFPVRLLISNVSVSDVTPKADDLKLAYKSNSISTSSSQESNDLANPSVNSSVNVGSNSSDHDIEANRRLKIRHFESSSDPTSILVSCFRSISSYFNLPFTKDKVSRTLSNLCSDGHDIQSLSVCAAIAESFGLQTQVLKLPLDYLLRLDIPAFLRFNSGEVCVALNTTETFITLSRPSLGIDQYTPAQLKDFTDTDGNIGVLIFRTTDLTPTKKFGLSWFLPSIRRHKRSLIEVFVASFFVQLFQLMNPLIIQQIIDKVIGQGGTGTLPVLAFLIFVFALFENLLTALRTNLFIETTNRIDLSLGEQVIDHLLRLPLTYFDKRPVGELSSRLAELEQIRSFLTGTALTVVLDFIFSFIYIAVMLVYSWVLTIVSLLVAPVLALITFTVSPVIRSQLREKAVLNAKTQNHLVEVLTGIQTVKAQNFETKARWRWKDRYSSYITQSFTNAVTSTTSNSFTTFLNQISSLSVLCVGAFLVINGQLSLGQLIAFRIISGYVTTPLLRLTNLYQSFQQTSISLERLADIIDFPVESGEVDQSNIPMPKISGLIEYKNVSFSFKPNTPLQLSNIDLLIPAGKFVAVVGQSGSGKSTLTKLLPRLYSPQAGTISIDNFDISKVELYSLRSQIGIVPQDSLLFEGTVQDNISLTNPEASTDDIVRAAKLACAHDFIMSLPSGYSTNVGERGGSLSGGQRQRIAIARSILQNPRLLIMDEATSALDYETERLVSLNLMEHFRERTCLFITHRLSSIVHADLIVLMHDGCVDEIGTHSELMERKGRYFALFNQQGVSEP